MYLKERHNLIARVLASLDHALLASHGCYFGGGTAIAMKYGEYRTSVDMDFLVSDTAGYRELRALTKLDGLEALVRPELRSLIATSPARTDQYGIRGFIGVGKNDIKFEIVAEGRIMLDTPMSTDLIEGISVLSEIDLVAEKLLANSDRYADTSVFSRDVIDLAFMLASPIQNHPGFRKARDAYGVSVEHDLAQAIKLLTERPDYLQRCIDALDIQYPRAVVLQKLGALQ